MTDATGRVPNTDKPDVCECCGADVDIKPYRNASHGFGGRRKESHKWLCLLCASTMTGSYHEYPDQLESGTLLIMRTICYVGNMVLKAINK